MSLPSMHAQIDSLQATDTIEDLPDNGPDDEPWKPCLAPEHELVSKSESNLIYPGAASTCEVLLCIVKIHSSDRGKEDPWRLSSEFQFIDKVRPAHTNIVRYFDVTDTHIFMEQCPLGSLDRYLTVAINPPVVDWTFQLCGAVDHIHKLGFAHNQLYPRHILVAKDGTTLKICDFSQVTTITGEAESGSTMNDPQGPGTMETSGARGQLFDVYCLGLLVCVIQHGGQDVAMHLKHGYKLSDTSGCPDFPAESGMQLSNFIQACWLPPTDRPSASALLEQLRSVAKPVDPSKASTVGLPCPMHETGCGDVSPLDYKPELLSNFQKFRTKEPAVMSEESSMSLTNICLAVVKIPDVRNDTPQNCFEGAISLEVFWNEHDFLQFAKIKHPNIVHYYGITENYIFMKHYPLGSLERYVTPDIKPPVFDWTLQLCSALSYLHGLGFAHNQLYPCNVLVGNGGADLLICDFGTVTRAHRFNQGFFPRAPELAITQHQTKAESQDARGDAADVYSLGLLVWFMQHGGKEIPNNYICVPHEKGYTYLDAIHSHLDMVDVTGLQLADFMRECWAPLLSRRTAKDLVGYSQAIVPN